ncbi:Hemolysin activation/secretion protein [Dyella sp. OK004]|uniref:ShlB/FhaC/HecB family hemolysin secretion/activation protein n=1 Tax=Dyella sp. OK004 TaxID=1855292 RepID=UPI0008F399D9|nr:POTRA domain-containing protein [Dyella sp. OK004]SFS04035.1 Hemolysin activation/secretion protein [Dyella sp. OK004]
MRRWVVLATTAMTSAVSWAQTRPPVANPLQTLPRVEAPAQPRVTLNVEQQRNDQMAALMAITLTPSRVDIGGVHSIPFEQVAALFKPLTGKNVRVADLVAAADACTKLYQKHDYALSFCYIPAQSFQNGVVVVNVVEGYVAAVEVSGDAGNMERKIRAIASHITKDRPLRRSTFERYIQILGMLPGAEIKADVPAPTTTDGATHLKLSVKRKRYNMSTGIDTNHPGVQGLFSGSLSGMTPLAEQLNASVLYPPGRGSQNYYDAGYAQMVGSTGLMGRLSGSHYHGNPDIDQQLPSYLRHRLTQDRVDLSFSYPLLLSSTRSLMASAGIYGSNQSDNYFNRINGASLVLKTDVRVLHAEVDFTQAAVKRTRKLGFGIAQGLDMWGAGATSTTNIPGAIVLNPTDVRFTRYNLNALQADTWGAHVGTVVSLVGQYSHYRLPTTEQISFGGPRFGLGYDPGAVSGDSGWGAALEVNRPFTVSAKWVKTLTPYVLGQTARVYVNGSHLPTDSLGTAAVGLRLTDSKHYTVDISAAQPVGDRPPNDRSRKVRYDLAFSYQLFQ